ncbi:putative ribonuclease H-like domain-containing protein [Tanacetum coccineum]
MQDQLLQFKLQKVWTLVDLPNGKKPIGTKWIFRNKKDERGIVIKNKARLVAQGYTQEKGIDYDEVFAPIARIEAIRLFLAYASFKDFVVYQMDVKSAFLYGKIEEEVYVCQPPGFEDPDFPDRVYKVEKVFYGLHQALRAWYETLSTYLLDNRFQRGKIDKTLFIRRDKGDILLVQVYVDDIIFGSTKKSLCTEFEKMMHKKFQMSSIGELTFFLRLQVKHKEDGIFISQDKYVTEILKKFGFTDVKTASTPMETQKILLKDEDGKEVDVHLYRSMIGLLMYLTSSRPDIMFTEVYNRRLSILGSRLISWQCKKQNVVVNSTTEAEYVVVSSCRRQVLWIQNQLLDYGDLRLEDVEGVDCLPNSTIFEQLAMMGPKTTAWNDLVVLWHPAIICLATNQKFNFLKLIFDSMIRNLDNLSGKFLMYPRFVQVFLDQQLDGVPTHKRRYIAPSHTKKIFGNMRRVGKGFSGRVTPLFPTMVVQNQSQLGKGSAIPTDPHHTPTIIQPSTQPQKTQKPRKPKRKVTQVPQPSDPIDDVADEAVHKELGDSLVRAATIASSLEVEQDSGNINKTQSKATPNESSSPGTHSGGSPRCQETMRDTSAQTRFERVSKHSNDSLLARGNTLRSDEDRLKLDELMELCTNLQNRVLDLEETKTTLQKENATQQEEIASLKRRVKKLERKDGSRTHGLKRLYKVGLKARVESSGDEESLGEGASKQGRIDVIDLDEGISLVNDADKEMFDMDALDGEEVFVEEVNEKVNIVEEVVEVINIAKLIIDAAQLASCVRIDPTTADDLTLAQALKDLKISKPNVKGIVIQELEIKSKKEQEDNIALIETWDDIQVKIDVDHQLAERMQAQEQEELSDAEKATLFMQLLEKRRKHFAAKRAEVEKKQTTNKSSTEKDNVYLPQEYGRIQAQ